MGLTQLNNNAKIIENIPAQITNKIKVTSKVGDFLSFKGPTSQIFHSGPQVEKPCTVIYNYPK